MENAISASNPIRFIDVYVENVDLRILGFDVRTLKSKRRTQFNHAGLQHETQYNYFWGTQFNCQTQELEVALKDQSLAFSKNGLFNLLYANGSSNNQTIKLSNSVIHISLKTNF